MDVMPPSVTPPSRSSSIYRRRYGRVWAIPLSLVILATSCEISSPDVPVELEDGIKPRQQEQELYFERVQVFNKNGKVISSTSFGEFDYQSFQATARPWTHLTHAYIYEDSAWSIGYGKHTVQTGYRVARRLNTEPESALPVPEEESPEVSPTMLSAVESSDDETPLEVLFKFNNYPDWDIPVLPIAEYLTAAVVSETLTAREQAFATRQVTLDELISIHLPPETLVDGAPVYRFPTSGWVVATLLRKDLIPLLEDPAFAAIQWVGENDATELWSLGGSRLSARLDVDQYHSAGIDGRIPSSRHAFGAITIGILEKFSYEDEACAFFDGANCTGPSRIVRRFSCTDKEQDGVLCGTPLEPTVPNFELEDQIENEGRHATAVASIAAGDYQDDQAFGFDLGDPDWIACFLGANTCPCKNEKKGRHCAEWRRNASGIAPEAKLVLAGELDPEKVHAAWAHALVRMQESNVDILNVSLGVGGLQPCGTDFPANIVLEETENLFDDGVFIAAAAGNFNAGVLTECNVIPPASLPKTFAVNAFNSSTPDCQGDPIAIEKCLIDAEYSATGGGYVIVDGKIEIDAISLIDTIAPVYLSHLTRPDGDRGEVVEQGNTPGTSLASPVVAGLAALVKHWYLAQGKHWIHFPGRLHTVMLAMTDRHNNTFSPEDPDDPTNPRFLGADKHYGLGRPRLRLIHNARPGGPWGEFVTTVTFTSPSIEEKDFLPFGPLPAGVDLIKCVLYQAEDMSGNSKSDISNLNLRVQLRSPVQGTCSKDGTLNPAYNRQDASLDIKSMVAFHTSSNDSMGKCIHVSVDPKHVSIQSGGISAQLMCYYGGTRDDEPQQ